MTARDHWCTPKWLADALPPCDVDPCANTYSCVPTKIILVEADNGLNPVWTHTYNRPFINPPYSRGQVIKWVRTWKHTDFIFLLRWDPSTEWFSELIEQTDLVWFARQRINFTPPPGIKASSNPYPHALFFKGREEAALDKLANLGKFFSPR